MKIEDLPFPVTVEAFVDFQEAGTGRKLGPLEREALGAWLPLFNKSFADGNVGFDGRICLYRCAGLLGHGKNRPFYQRGRFFA